MKLSVKPGQYVLEQFRWLTPATVFDKYVERCLAYGYAATVSLGPLFWFEMSYNTGECTFVYSIDSDADDDR